MWARKLDECTWVTPQAPHCHSFLSNLTIKRATPSGRSILFFPLWTAEPIRGAIPEIWIVPTKQWQIHWWGLYLSLMKMKGRVWFSCGSGKSCEFSSFDYRFHICIRECNGELQRGRANSTRLCELYRHCKHRIATSFCLIWPLIVLLLPAGLIWSFQHR